MEIFLHMHTFKTLQNKSSGALTYSPINLRLSKWFPEIRSISPWTPWDQLNEYTRRVIATSPCMYFPTRRLSGSSAKSNSQTRPRLEGSRLETVSSTTKHWGHWSTCRRKTRGTSSECRSWGRGRWRAGRAWPSFPFLTLGSSVSRIPGKTLSTYNEDRSNRSKFTYIPDPTQPQEPCLEYSKQFYLFFITKVKAVQLQNGNSLKL